jgi:ribA/ribD-fused uncharacterized protein
MQTKEISVTKHEQNLIKKQLYEANILVNEAYNEDDLLLIYNNKEFHNQFLKSGQEYIHFLNEGPLKGYYLICDVNGIISNWYYSPFIINGEKYNCVEQFMMSEKAKKANDNKSKIKIMNSTCPKLMKFIGKKIIKMTPKQLELWDNEKFDIVTQGVIAKFSQNEQLKKWLFIIKNYIIAEASKYDYIWGIGKTKYDDSIHNYHKWGNNLLGKCIMTAAIKIFNIEPCAGMQYELSRI